MPPSDGIPAASPASPASRARYRRILRFASGVLIQLWWFELVLPRLGLRRLALRHRTARLQRLARRFHVLAAELGGLMIKVGQFLSSRLDVLPPEVTRELEGLQDEVAARASASIASRWDGVATRGCWVEWVVGTADVVKSGLLYGATTNIRECADERQRGARIGDRGARKCSISFLPVRAP